MATAFAFVMLCRVAFGLFIFQGCEIPPTSFTPVFDLLTVVKRYKITSYHLGTFALVIHSTHSKALQLAGATSAHAVLLSHSHCFVSNTTAVVFGVTSWGQFSRSSLNHQNATIGLSRHFYTNFPKGKCWTASLNTRTKSISSSWLITKDERSKCK